MPDKQLQELLNFATEVIESAGEIALKYFRSPITVDNKKGSDSFDPVTVADKEIELYIRGRIADSYPQYSILGEEQQEHQGNDDFKWVIDPIDGTRAFISGTPLWGILLGLMEGNDCQLGLMHQPYLHETFIGSSVGAFLKKGSSTQPIATRDTSELSEAILYCTQPSFFTSAADLDAFNQFAGHCNLMCFGGDCYSYCLLANGFIDLVIDGSLKPWDIIPLIPIIEATGGIVTDWRGETATVGGNIIAAANPELHEKTIEFFGSNL